MTRASASRAAALQEELGLLGAPVVIEPQNAPPCVVLVVHEVGLGPAGGASPTHKARDDERARPGAPPLREQDHTFGHAVFSPAKTATP